MTGRNSAVSSARRLNLTQNPDETLHIRRLENGLERPCGRSGENLGHFSSLVGVVVIARKLTYGNSVAIPEIVKSKNMRRYRKDSWLTRQSAANRSAGQISLRTGKFTGKLIKFSDRRHKFLNHFNGLGTFSLRGIAGNICLSSREINPFLHGIARKRSN